MFTISSLFIATITLIIGVLSAVYAPKAVRAVKEMKSKMKQRRVKGSLEEEYEEDKELLEGRHSYSTLDGKAIGIIDRGVMVEIRLGKKGKPYPTIEDLVMNEEMDKLTYQQLMNTKRRLENLEDRNHKDTHKPEPFTKYNTESQLGRDLYVYRPSTIRFSDRVSITIKDTGNGLDMVSAYGSFTDLDDTDSVIDFVFYPNEFHTEDDAEADADGWEKFMAHPAMAAEAAEIKKIEERLEYYNHLLRTNSIEIHQGRLYIRGKALVEHMNNPKTPVVPESALRRRRDGIRKDLESAVDLRPAREPQLQTASE